jgi:hypothetical protein
MEAGRRLAGLAFRGRLLTGQGASPCPEMLAASRPRGPVYAEREDLSMYPRWGSRSAHASLRFLLQKSYRRCDAGNFPIFK